MDDKIKIGFCVAYDWRFLKHSLPLIYPYADVICLSIDHERTSWSGQKYVWDEDGFNHMIEAIDVDQKITIVQEDYHLQGLSPMENEVRQRNRLAIHLQPGGWHIQLDCDEYFQHFGTFVDYLKRLPEQVTVNANVCCAWIHLFKKIPEGFLVVDPMVMRNVEFMQIATKCPVYEYGRRNGNFNLYTNFRIIHQSWARDVNEIKEKIYNWGHSNDIDKHHYFAIWKNLAFENFRELRDFHPIQPAVWPRLQLVKGSSISEIQKNLNTIPFPAFGKAALFFRNSRFFSRVRRLKKWINPGG